MKRADSYQIALIGLSAIATAFFIASYFLNIAFIKMAMSL